MKTAIRLTNNVAPVLTRSSGGWATREMQRDREKGVSR